MEYCRLNLSSLNIDKGEIFLGMGYKKHIPEENILLSVDRIYNEISRICDPQYVYEIYDGSVLDKVSVEIGYKRFKPGRIITRYLYGMEKCCVFATTAGTAYDKYKKQLRDKGEILEEFIADSIGSVIAEACVTKISDELAMNVNDDFTYPYSPGYCGWKLTEQQLLFSLLPDNPCGIILTDSCLMLPIKSVSGIIGIGRNIERKAYSCNICENKNCYKRKEV